MKKIKLLLMAFMLILSLFLLSPALPEIKAEEATFLPEGKESAIKTKIEEEINFYIKNNQLAEWHSNFIYNDGYLTFYWKTVHLSEDFTTFASYTEKQIREFCKAYQSERSEMWDTIISNLDIEPYYLDQDQYLGLYWDSYAYDNPNNGFLYLIWTSRFLPSEFVTITEFIESGKTYKLYDSAEKADKIQWNWDISSSYHYAGYDLSIHLTPIGGITQYKDYNGVSLKQKYSFEGFKYEIDDAFWGKDVDTEKLFSGKCDNSIEFDLGLTPKLDGKNSMQMVTHAYEIIKDCEVQSHFDAVFGGYKHYAMFNTTINIDKIYRVDVNYMVTNDNREWWQFFLPIDEHEVYKSLTCKRIRGGIFNLGVYQGFAEGSFQSTVDDATNYKYRLHLNYNDTAWNPLIAQDFYESDYKRVSSFKILRLNFLIDNETYDVPIKMDTVEGDTLLAVDKELIINTNTNYYKFKDWVDDVTTLVTNKEKAAKVFWALIGAAGLVIIVWIVFKIYKFIKRVVLNNQESPKENTMKGKDNKYEKTTYHFSVSHDRFRNRDKR